MRCSAEVDILLSILIGTLPRRLGGLRMPLGGFGDRVGASEIAWKATETIGTSERLHRRRELEASTERGRRGEASTKSAGDLVASAESAGASTKRGA